MAEGRERSLWRHTAALRYQIVALLDGRASPEDFDPFAAMDREPAPEATPEQQARGWAAVKRMFV